ncbi:MAG: hypothetical protein ACRYHQ_41025 [Janthinobacterium lividum]
MPDNLTLLHLPPCSRELNPVEAVRAWLSGTTLGNRVRESYDAILSACAGAWNSLISVPARITSIATRPWAQVMQ